MVSDHKCALCLKGFLSGSALGGHMSNHDLCKIIESKGELKAGMLTFGKKKNRCGVCEGLFCSANSLLLHMGSHKEGDVRTSTENKYLPSSSRVTPDMRTALDYLRQLLGCSSSSAGHGVEEKDIALNVKPVEELRGRGQEGFPFKSLGKRKRSEKENHNSVRKTAATGMAAEMATLQIEEPQKRSTGRVSFVRDFNLNEFPTTEREPVVRDLDLNKLPSPEPYPDEWNNRDRWGEAEPSYSNYMG